jgi:hypothetical protein
MRASRQTVRLRAGGDLWYSQGASNGEGGGGKSVVGEGERESERAGGWVSLLQGAVQVWLCETHISRNFQQLDIRFCLLDFLPKHLKLYNNLCFWLYLYFCPPHAQICAASNATCPLHAQICAFVKRATRQESLKCPHPLQRRQKILGVRRYKLTHKDFGHFENRSSVSEGEGSKTSVKQTSILLSI